jgi:protein TilB
MQEYDSLQQMIIDQQMQYLEKRTQEKQDTEKRKGKKPDGNWYTDINSHDKSEEKEAGECCMTGDAEDDSFWHEKMTYTPESRIEMHRRLSQERKDVEAPKPSPWQVPKREIRLTTEEGRVLNINQGKWDFSLNDGDLGQSLVLDVAVQRYLDTSLIDCDVQPGHVKCLIKGKVLQIVLPEEVNPDQSTAKRSQTTGHLVITMPKAKQIVRPQRSPRKPTTRPCRDPLAQPKLNFLNQTVSCEKLEVDPSVATRVNLKDIVSNQSSLCTVKQEVKCAVQDELVDTAKSNSEMFVDDLEVPPLM